jgi:hypothetical protein
MKGRKVFNHMHEELSLLKGELFPRMRLWEEVGEYYDPMSLTKMDGYNFLANFLSTLLPEVPVEKRQRMLKRFRRWDPNADTPEEIFTRICGGKPQDT